MIFQNFIESYESLTLKSLGKIRTFHTYTTSTFIRGYITIWIVYMYMHFDWSTSVFSWHYEAQK